MERFIRWVFHPRFFVLWVWRKCSKIIKSDALYLKVYYRLWMKERLNFDNPQNFNQKIQWLKLHNTDDRYTQMVDKYRVREIIKNELGEEYLIPLFGVWEKFENIDFNELPNQFVLKTNHTSGGVVICKDKRDFNQKEARTFINKSLRINYFYEGRETPYKNVRPCIIAEKYMVDESGIELKDYKLFCFNGEVKYIQVDFSRFVNHKRNIYDVNWNLMELQILYPSDTSIIIPKPICLDEMISIAEHLSKSILFLRVDLYVINDKVFFGENTFHHGGGLEPFLPSGWNRKFGELIQLPICVNQ